MDIRVISIGTLASNELWNESGPVRTGHATSTLVRSGRAVILVDPGLPGPAMGPRLYERSGLLPENITHVFLTSFQPDVFRGIDAFPEADWLIGEEERDGAGAAIRELAAGIDESGGEDAGSAIADLERAAKVLKRCEIAPERLAPGVDLFPLPGVTPGLLGLLIARRETTILIAGDAVASLEHIEQSRVLPTCADLTKAKESFREALEIADLIVCGRDNVITLDAL